jgi:predicted PurR-regulated permease PerM
MPRRLPRAMALALTLIAVSELGSWAFHQLTELLINILIAFFLALAVEPAVRWMAAHGMRRGLATFLVFLGLMIVAAGFVALLGSKLAGQIIKWSRPSRTTSTPSSTSLSGQGARAFRPGVNARSRGVGQGWTNRRQCDSLSPFTVVRAASSR